MQAAPSCHHALARSDALGGGGACSSLRGLRGQCLRVLLVAAAALRFSGLPRGRVPNSPGAFAELAVQVCETAVLAGSCAHARMFSRPLPRLRGGAVDLQLMGITCCQRTARKKRYSGYNSRRYATIAH